VNANASMASQVAAFKSCANCGSQQYSEKRVWPESKAGSDGTER
jgi:hypothetical protein